MSGVLCSLRKVHTHAVSGYTPRHDEVAESMPKANEEGEGKDAHYPSDSRYRGYVA